MPIVPRPLAWLTDRFFAGGWLAVAALPYAQILGRGVFNVLGTLFLGWGMASLIVVRPRFDRIPILLLGALLLSFATSTVLAADTGIAISRLKTFLLYCGVWLPVYGAIRNANDLARLNYWLAVTATLAIMTLAVRYLLSYDEVGFLPERDMREDNLPLLLPFLLLQLRQVRTPSVATTLKALVVASFSAYVIISNGRAALVGLLTALTVYGILAARLRPLQILAIAGAIVVAAVMLRGESLYRGATLDADRSAFVNTITSYRAQLWRNAFDTPPANVWFGAGMGNIPESVLFVPGANATKLGHLHNFLLDCGYENGLVGLGFLIAFISYCLARGFANWRWTSGESRLLYGTLLAASAAILANALLSYSYTSKQFAIYLMMFVTIASKALQSERSAPSDNRSVSPPSPVP